MYIILSTTSSGYVKETEDKMITYLRTEKIDSRGNLESSRFPELFVSLYP